MTLKRKIHYFLTCLMLFVFLSPTELTAKHKKKKKRHPKVETQAPIVSHIVSEANPWIFEEGKNYATCKWIGELGNQLFQVAAVLAYARDHNYEAVFPNFDTAAGGKENYRYVFYRLNVLPPNHNISFIEQ